MGAWDLSDLICIFTTCTAHTHEEIDLLIALTQQHELLSRITHVVTSAITIKLKGAPKLIY